MTSCGTVRGLDLFNLVRVVIDKGEAPATLMLGMVRPGARAFGKPPFSELLACTDASGKVSARALVWVDDRYQLLEMLNKEGFHSGADYYRCWDALDGSEDEDEGDVDAFRIWTDGQGRALPRSGSSLINGLFAIRHGRLPGEEEVRQVREAVQRLLAQSPEAPGESKEPRAARPDSRPGPAVQWGCPVCTLLNSPSAMACEACNTPK